MLIVEILALLFGIRSAVLTVKEKVSCWWTGIISLGFYSYILSVHGINGDMIIQFIFMIQSGYGWYKWYQGEQDDSLRISKFSFNVQVQLFTYALLAFVFLRKTMMLLSLSEAATIDAAIVVTSLCALTLCIYKKIENWFYWVVVDLLHIGMFIEQKLYVSALSYFLFLIIAITGYIQWKKEYSKRSRISLANLASPQKSY